MSNNALKTSDPELKRLLKQLEEEKAKEALLHDEIIWREEQLNSVLSSTSWKLTRPFRMVTGAFKLVLRKTRRGKRLLFWVIRGKKAGNYAERIMLRRDNLSKDAATAIRHKDWGTALESLLGVVEDLWQQRFQISVVSRLKDVDAYKQMISSYGRQTKRKKPRIAIYTAISGNYETLKLPETLDPRFDYVVFTDKSVPDTGVFKVRPITYFNHDPTRTARFIKTHPHAFLPDYDIAIWLDASIMITGDIYPMVEKFIESDKPLGAIPHPHRQTVYQELEACLALSKDGADEMVQQVERYRKAGYDGTGLIESGLMMFNMKSISIENLLNTWWQEIDNFSRRDQLSLGYAIHQNGTEWHRLTEPPHSIRDHPLFVLTVHGSSVEKLMNELIYSIADELIDPYDVGNYTSVRTSRIAAQKDRHIDIVVCVHNAPDEVKLCLESIENHRKSTRQKLIIVDDGSDQPAANLVKDFVSTRPWAKLIRHNKAKGYTKAANAGMKASTGELVILLNSDTVVSNGWAEKMADALFSTPSAGMVGPLSSAASVQSIPDYRSSRTQTAINDLPPGLTIDDMNQNCESWAYSEIRPFATMLHGFCLGISRDVLSNVGLFDEKNFPKGYGEENDYCFRAVDAGFGLVVADQTYVFHAKSKSYKDEVRVGLMESGAAKLRELYGKRRITNAIRSMQDNPLLVRIRDESKKLY